MEGGYGEYNGRMERDKENIKDEWKGGTGNIRDEWKGIRRI